MADMVTRAAIAIGNWWRTTPAEDRVSNVGAVRAALFAALDPEDEALAEAVSKEIAHHFDAASREVGEPWGAALSAITALRALSRSDGET